MSNTVNMEFDTERIWNNIYMEEDTDWTAAEKVHNTLCSKHVRSFIYKGYKKTRKI